MTSKLKNVKISENFEDPSESTQSLKIDRFNKDSNL